jgi:hypothetical protein
VVIVPPRDPPTISASKARVAQIFYNVTPGSSSGEATLTTSVLEDRIRAQYYGATTAAFFYQVIAVHAYAGGAGSADIAISDLATGVTAVDTGSFADRAKVGIAYPPVAQTIRPTGVAGNIWLVKTPAVEVDLYVKVRFWDSPSVQVAPPGLAVREAAPRKKQGRLTPTNREQEFEAIKASDLLGY